MRIDCMKIWLDADAAPRAVREILVRASLSRAIPMTFVANRGMEKPRSAWVEVVAVKAGMDAADDHIVENLVAGDLVITFDIPLAARAVEKGAMVITPYGQELDEGNVRERLSIRDFAQELRDMGVATGGPAPFGEGEKRAFAGALDRWATMRKRAMGS